MRVALIGLALLLAGCGSVSAPAAGTHTGGGAAGAGAGQGSSVGLPQDLSFSGPFDAHLTSAMPNTCHFAANDQSLAVLVGQAAGVSLGFTLFVPLYNHGPGTYWPQPHSEQGVLFSAGGTTYRTRINTQTDSVDSGDFTIQVNADQKSGSVTGRLGVYNSGSGSVGVLSEAVTGHWRCG